MSIDYRPHMDGRRERVRAVATMDGRRLRRTSNRDAVLDALVALFREGHYQPTTAEIAARAGLSLRSLFRYFEDVDDLHRAAIEQQLEAARPLVRLRVSPGDPLPVRIRALVASRVRLYETIAPAARAARVCATRHPVVRRQLRDSRAFLRRQVERLFAGDDKAAAVLPAVDALCSFESYELMRHDRGLSRARTAAVLEGTLCVLLGAGSCP